MNPLAREQSDTTFLVKKLFQRESAFKKKIPLQLLFIKQSLKDGWKEWVPWERKERNKGNEGLAKYHWWWPGALSKMLEPWESKHFSLLETLGEVTVQ